MKKIGIIILCICLLFSAAGCGKKQEKPEQGSVNEAQGQASMQEKRDIYFSLVNMFVEDADALETVYYGIITQEIILLHNGATSYNAAREAIKNGENAISGDRNDWDRRLSAYEPLITVLSKYETTLAGDEEGIEWAKICVENATIMAKKLSQLDSILQNGLNTELLETFDSEYWEASDTIYLTLKEAGYFDAQE